MNMNAAKTAKLDISTGTTIAHDSSMGQGPRTGAAVGTARTSADSLAKHTQLIAECAYFAAEKRNFTGGDPIQDWLVAEREVCSKNP